MFLCTYSKIEDSAVCFQGIFSLFSPFFLNGGAAGVSCLCHMTNKQSNRYPVFFPYQKWCVMQLALRLAFLGRFEGPGKCIMARSEVYFVLLECIFLTEERGSQNANILTQVSFSTTINT